MKNNIRAVAVIGIATILLSSCGPTKYISAGSSFWTGQCGYSESPLDSATWQVTFMGNDNTADELVNRYALYRSAELTVQHGFDYYVVMNNNDVAALTSTVNHNNKKETSTQYKVDPYTGKPVPVTVTNSNSTSTVTTTASHTVTKTIRMFAGARPADNPDAYDARSMLAAMGPTIQR